MPVRLGSARAIAAGQSNQCTSGSPRPAAPGRRHRRRTGSAGRGGCRPPGNVVHALRGPVRARRRSNRDVHINPSPRRLRGGLRPTASRQDRGDHRAGATCRSSGRRSSTVPRGPTMNPEPVMCTGSASRSNGLPSRSTSATNRSMSARSMASIGVCSITESSTSSFSAAPVRLPGSTTPEGTGQAASALGASPHGQATPPVRARTARPRARRPPTTRRRARAARRGSRSAAGRGGTRRTHRRHDRDAVGRAGRVLGRRAHRRREDDGDPEAPAGHRDERQRQHVHREEHDERARHDHARAPQRV